jgi:hypothetical protein
MEATETGRTGAEWPDVHQLQKMEYDMPADGAGLPSVLYRPIHSVLPLRSRQGKPFEYVGDLLPARKAQSSCPQTYVPLSGIRPPAEVLASLLSMDRLCIPPEEHRSTGREQEPNGRKKLRVYALGKSLQYLADPRHPISADGFYRLYQTSVGIFLPAEKQLPAVLSSRENTAGFENLQRCLTELTAFVGRRDSMEPLVKAAAVHSYLALERPFPDGNGLMACLLQLWYLSESGCPLSSLFPLAPSIQRSRKQYLEALRKTQNAVRGRRTVNITPLLSYFLEFVYGPLGPTGTAASAALPGCALQEGKPAAEQEQALWRFVLDAYGEEAFSALRLKRDFGGATYPSVRAFAAKFVRLGLLSVQRSGNHIRYRVSGI